MSGMLRMGNFDAYGGIYAGSRIGGIVGLSLSLLHLEGELLAENGMFGSYIKGGVDILKGELKADVSAGLYDADGKLNPSFYGNISAEALIADASLSYGVKCGDYVDAGFKCSLNVGFGGHAILGFTDGKFKVDIGASFVVGGSISIEIDASGAIDALAGEAESLISQSEDAWDNLIEQAEEAQAYVAEKAEDTFDSIIALLTD